ncbi:hypothetical protein HJG60_009846 [Phyllostomus discolor]|uniref:Uncharacterized protein n=1 Tax=Phyllostomus discolor TaxID=89673 RepID=A0A834B2N2_9CHIR|nr:hypothetical protein HJG60_009846 [Phyllostomus discolor]
MSRMEEGQSHGPRQAAKPGTHLRLWGRSGSSRAPGGLTCRLGATSPLTRLPPPPALAHWASLRRALGTQRAAAEGTQLPKTGAGRGPPRKSEEAQEAAGHSPATGPLGLQLVVLSETTTARRSGKPSEVATTLV